MGRLWSVDNRGKVTLGKFIHRMNLENLCLNVKYVDHLVS